ncbi:MAG: hypothetical protein EAZ84_05030 [Verrucomicrobia bacterium]|nr:MAG: hypothetical protein EAZ84_05030 [Verrucomicrobiota bacterium]TAE88666.1 MAG: hypothetical protein EAZ82_02865 [Verrucomicrobiota bacterium]TAF26468.1 MAG: hypothetical protein EAZ71_04390 [Verrucomicrobiota bacterium]
MPIAAEHRPQLTLAEKPSFRPAAPADPTRSAARSSAPAPRLVRTSLAGIPITAIAFDARTHRLVVADQADGPGSQWPDAQSAATSQEGIAALNGGFFTPEGQPLGLVASEGKQAGSVNRASSLGSGFYMGGTTPALARRESAPRGPELLQSGPFLVEQGRPVAGLSTASSTARSFIGWDGSHGWFIARSGACSLQSLAKALASNELGGVPARHVLNLDGGRSSDLWISRSIPGGPLEQRPPWNKPVRNFLVLLPR